MPPESGNGVAPADATVSQTKSASYLWFYAVGVLAALLIGASLFIWYQKGASKPEKVYHVGILDALDFFTPAIDGFKSKMNDLGYVEGENITYDVEKGPMPTGNQGIIKKFVNDKVDLIVAFPTEASQEAIAGTKGTDIPIISLMSATEGTGLIQSITHPGGNLTAVRFPVPEAAAKRLQLLHQIDPKASRIWIPYLKDYPTVPVGLAGVEPVAKELNITLVETPFSTPDEMAAFLTKQGDSPAFDAILTIPEPLSIIPAFYDQIYAYSYAHDLPIAGPNVTDDDHGPLFSLIPDAKDAGMLAAPIAKKIFTGTPVGDIPVVSPELVFDINDKVAEHMKLTVSESILSTANKVVH